MRRVFSLGGEARWPQRAENLSPRHFADGAIQRIEGNAPHP